MSDDEKAAIAAALLHAKPSSPIEPGKPEFPSLRPNMDLEDLVGPQSWVFFNHLREVDEKRSTQKWSSEWLQKPVCEWADDNAFLAIKAIVHAFHGVNDTAERGCRTAELFKVKYDYL